MMSLNAVASPALQGWLNIMDAQQAGAPEPFSGVYCGPTGDKPVFGRTPVMPVGDSIVDANNRSMTGYMSLATLFSVFEYDFTLGEFKELLITMGIIRRYTQVLILTEGMKGKAEYVGDPLRMFGLDNIVLNKSSYLEIMEVIDAKVLQSETENPYSQDGKW